LEAALRQAGFAVEQPGGGGRGSNVLLVGVPAPR